MTSLQHLIEQPLVHRFGLTLLHFLWQGAAVAIVMTIVFRLLRRRSAELRYVASVAGLVLMVVLPVVTFSLVEVPTASTEALGPSATDQMNAPESPHAAGPGASLLAPTAGEGAAEGRPALASQTESATSEVQPASGPEDHVLAASEGAAAADSPAGTRWVDRIRPTLPWIVLAWVVGVLFFSTRLAGGWLYVVRLRRHSAHKAAEPVVRTADRLCQRLGIRRAVTLLESALVSVPSAVGLLRPVILLPASTLMGLTPEQLESLLAHELAHIRRHDYLVNALQCVIEALLFYHPAVWWLSGRIRTERENCCDDLAVQVVGNRLLYARALADMADLGQRQRQLALTAGGGNLAGRIRRLLGAASDAPARHSAWWAGAILLLTVAGITLALSLGSAARLARAEDGQPAALDEAESAAAEEDVPAAVDSKTGTASQSGAKEPAEEPAFRLFDGFDGRPALDWDIVRPDPTHVSLAKNPGKLTITTQRGSIYGDPETAADKDPPKNFYLIPNPASEGAGFVITTCIESFHPKVPYQQAGLLVYDDEDNYLKWVMEHALNSPSFTLIHETDQQPVGDYNRVPDEPNLERFWLRLMKRGKWYQYSYSTDGEQYTLVDEVVWGTGAPQWVGILAKVAQADEEIDARFDSFEIRSLTLAERDDPEFLARQELYGTWEVVSASFDGKPLEKRPLSRFAFDARQLAVTEGRKSIRTEYTLDVTNDPKVLLMSGAVAGGPAPVRAVYSSEADSLVLCFNPRPEAPAPEKLETNEGDGRFLITFRRMSADEVAAIRRDSQSWAIRFQNLDKDNDQLLTLQELTADRTSPASVEQAAGILKGLDKDADGKLTLDEFTTWSREVQFLRFDLNADGGLSVHEFFGADMRSATAEQTRRVFALVDKDHDGLLSLDEYSRRTAEAWFAKLDTNGNQRLTLSEYAAGNQPQVRTNRCDIIFAELDRNGDGTLSLEEFDDTSEEVSFHWKDSTGDRKLDFKEYALWLKTPKEIEDGRKQFAAKDTDGDALLTFKEYAYRSSDVAFWKADQDGDDRLSPDEFKAGRPSETVDQLEAAFKAIDQNGDGKISLAEFNDRAAADKPDAAKDDR